MLQTDQTQDSRFVTHYTNVMSKHHRRVSVQCGRMKVTVTVTIKQLIVKTILIANKELKWNVKED